MTSNIHNLHSNVGTKARLINILKTNILKVNILSTTYLDADIDQQDNNDGIASNMFIRLKIHLERRI